MKMIRWSGLLIFVVLLAVIVAFWWFFAAPLLKNGIEDYGSELVGAKVEISSLALNISPFGFSLHKLSVADPEQAMSNLFEFSSADAHVDFMKLLMGQFIIDDLEIEGLLLNGQRSSSGLLNKTTQPEKNQTAQDEEGMFEDISLELPSADEILKREPLLLEQRKLEWDSLYDLEREKIKTIIKTLPDKEKINGYEKEIDVITKGEIKSVQDFDQRRKKLKLLKRAIKHDRDNLRLANKQYKESYTALKKQLILLKQAPGEDWKNIKEKYGIDELGASNISKLLFGETITEVSEQIIYWYTKIKPLLLTNLEDNKQELEAKPERAKGRYIHFPITNPSPDFLIRSLALSMKLDKGSISGSMRDITHQPQIIARPMLLKIDGEGLDSIKVISINGTFDHISPVQSLDKVKFMLEGVTLNKIEISKSHHLPITLSSAKGDIEGNLSFGQGIFSGKTNSTFSDAIFSSSAKEGLAKEIGLALAKVEQFDLQVGLKGEIDDIDINIKSDLDRRLKNAVKGRLKDKEKQFEEKLKIKLDNELEKYLADDNKQLQNLLKEQGSIDSRLAGMEKMLKQKLDDYADIQKQQLKDKADKEEEKLKEKQNEKEDELEKKLKDKLKGLWKH